MSSFNSEQLNKFFEKTSEELICLYQELNKQIKKLETEKNSLSRDITIIEKEQTNIDTYKKKILIEIQLREAIEETRNMLSEEIKHIENFELLSETEFAIITSKMDKTDYTKYGDFPRWIDLRRICKEVIDIKKTYPKWTLTNLEKGNRQYSKVPPHTYYKYEYKNEYNIYLYLGNINLRSS